jgi:type II secretory pathway component PulF
MIFYYIEAIDLEGRKIRKTIHVSDEQSLIQLLEFLNLIPIKIKKLPKYYQYLQKINIFKHKIKKEEVIEILDNLHLIVKSGLPLNVGLLDLAEDAENPAIKDMLLDISLKIQSGQSLSDAVKNYRDVFSDVVISLFKIGEETGNLDKTLKDAAEHLKRIQDLKSKAKQALIYPAFAFISILGAMIFWLVYVLPKIIEAFQDFNIKLPMTTIILMKMSEFTQNYILYMIFSLIILFVILKILRAKNEKVRYYTDFILLRIPVFGVILANFNYAFFAEYIRLMISAGLALIQALNIMGESLNNYVFKLAAKNAREKVELGESLSTALKEEGIFSSLIIRMISVGEQTGGLEEQLNYISNYYYNKVEYISQNIAKMIEPIIIGVLGVFMLLIVLGLIGPIYDLISNLSGRM